VSDVDASTPVRVGLVGAGPWAKMVHAPVLAAGPETQLAGVWARRIDAAERLATRYAAPSFASREELYANCDAVAFAVPPDVQADLATEAARAGKSVLLEKPIAGDLAGAKMLADAIDAAGVASMVVLSWRYSDVVRAFVEQARAGSWLGGRGVFVSGAFVGDSPFKTPWRLERGPLLDLGPHVLDLLDAALGPITSIAARGDVHGMVGVLCEHEGGAVSDAVLSANVPLSPHRAGVELFGGTGELSIDCVTAVGPEAFATMRTEFAEAVQASRSEPANGLGVRRGLHLQRLLADAEAQLLR
jgi:predicted dehydrogenase